jgi:hypothetical protein
VRHIAYQGWDVAGDLYSMIGERGSWRDRVVVLDDLVDRGELAAIEPGTVSHYCHAEDLAGMTIEGKAVRGMCGVFFVPTQDHAKRPLAQSAIKPWPLYRNSGGQSRCRRISICLA